MCSTVGASNTWQRQGCGNDEFQGKLGPRGKCNCKNRYAGMKLRKTLVLAGLSLTFALIFPELLFTIVGLNLVALITVMGLQVIVTRWPVEPLEQNNLAGEPFVSIHVPAHNEPPEL